MDDPNPHRAGASEAPPRLLEALGGVSVDEAMRQALAEAARAAEHGEVPVGCVIFRRGEVIATGRNRREAEQRPTGHAELDALEAAARALGTWRLDDCVVVVTLEPCAMCAGAMVHSRVLGCIYGCTDPKGGFLGTLGDLSAHHGLNHRFDVLPGVLATECSHQLKGFFRQLRERRRARDSEPLEKRFEERWPSG